MDFATENLVIISSKHPIQMIQWRAHLAAQWEEVMKENTRLLVVAGPMGVRMDSSGRMIKRL